MTPVVRGPRRPAHVTIIGVPMDLGAGRRGVDMGPSALRIAALEQRIESLDISVQEIGDLPIQIPEQLSIGRADSKYLAEISAACDQLSGRVQEALDADSFPLVLGGDHSIEAGTVSGLSAFLRSRGQRAGVLWIDAHADMNTPASSPSGNVHGMPLAALVGLPPEALSEIGGFAPKVHPGNTVVVGARSIDKHEAETIRDSGVRVITMSEIDRRGLSDVMDEAIELATEGTEGFHCSFDLDAIDPVVAPGVGTPVAGGMTFREAHLAMEMVYESSRCLSLGIVELNPVIDSANQTARLAVGLVASALGKKIL